MKNRVVKLSLSPTSNNIYQDILRKYTIAPVYCSLVKTLYHAELEIAVGHWPFSDQFQDLTDQN